MTGSDAAYYRRHGAALRLAWQLGCTPREAEAELDRRDAIARGKAASARLDAKRNAPLARQEPGTVAPTKPNPRWMMRD